MNLWLRELINVREQAKRHLRWLRSPNKVEGFDKRLALKGIYGEPKGKWKLNLSDKAAVDHVIVTTEEGGYLVSILKEPNQNKESYIEIMVKDGHRMYERINDAISILNIAGPLVEVVGVGETYQEGTYHVILTREEHTAFING